MVSSADGGRGSGYDGGGASGSGGDGAGCGGDFDGDEGGGDGDGGGGSKLEMCTKPGCTASAHEECRRLLARRIKVWWEGDAAWYWGTAMVEELDEEGGCLVQYDDGTRQVEQLGVAAGQEAECCEWLVARRPGQRHAAVWRLACTCSKGVVVEQGMARDLEDDARCCAICCISDYRYRSEPGDVNHLVYCDGCGICVHMFCYGMNAGSAPMFGRQAVESLNFLCDVCLRLGPECSLFDDAIQPATPPKAARGRKSAHPTCSLCSQSGGALRLQRNGSWVHVSCVLYGRFEWSRSAPGHVSSRLCPRTSGCEICLKDSFRDGVGRKGIMDQVKARSWRCFSPGCPDPKHTAGLVICGSGQGAPGCMRATHVSCAQRPGSGWHMMLKEIDSSTPDGATALEITCAECADLFLDVSGPKPFYREQFPMLTAGSPKYVTDEEYAAAQWTFMDWAHGPCFGFTRVGHRGDGLCVGACDSDATARMQYMATFANQNEPLECISKMGTDPRVARSATIIFCGFCCKPFSCAGRNLGFEDERFGNNFALLAQALQERKELMKLSDPCLICENVPTFLNHLEVAHLESLGYFCKIFVVSGSQFRCASARQRLVLVAFRDKAALERFTPPPPQATTPTPLRTVLKHYSNATGHELFIGTSKFNKAGERSHVVSPGFALGTRSPTSSYGSLQTPGTLLCLASEHEAKTTPLSAAEIKRLHMGELRKLHPTEQLASFSYEPHEYPQCKGGLNEQCAPAPRPV